MPILHVGSTSAVPNLNFFTYGSAGLLLGTPFGVPGVPGVNATFDYGVIGGGTPNDSRENLVCTSVGK
jgi:hypothetical protein